jgi:uncharacterized protein YbjT (DUF2867 family)
VLITPVCPESAEYAIRFIDIAKSCGVQHVVRISGAIAELGSSTMLGSWHRSVEEHLSRSGLSFSVVRPTLFMQNFASYYRPDSLGYFYLPSGEGRANYIDARDIADVVVHLIQTGVESTAPLLLTGPAPLHRTEVARLFSAATGRKIRSGRITPRQAALGMRLMGLPRWAVGAFREVHELICEGFYESRSDVVLEKSWHQPRSLSVFACDNAAAFETPNAGWASSLAAKVLVGLAPR